ncbi:TolC family protein [Mucilaginibacter sabulilitoris]|uniref:TolC family protein n=1 Tax=Mucilaginibacter sabulilitoris TaxID=1173583 RepID=A0ABZ0TP26_9SPHI|nr:TolC family protein [Mucilaginibacter sabulilitoris]WPU94677.1 TolC family protein [Mucilaginibacter sabulilitoris]
MKKIFLLLLAAGLQPVKSLKAQTAVLPLDSVLVRINRINPALLAYTSKAVAQKEYAKGARNLDAPQISAGQYQTPYGLNPNTGSFMIQAQQQFVNPAKLRANERYMEGMSAVTEQEHAYLKNRLLAQARSYYYDQAVLEKKLTLLENTRKLLEYMLKDAHIKLTYGKEKLPNLYKAKADIFELDNLKLQLGNQLLQNTVMLNTLMNQDKQIVFEVDTAIAVQNYETLQTDTATLAAARSDIKLIDRNIRLQQLNTEVQYSKRKPDFGIQAAHMFSYGGNSNQYILMASVTIPIVPWASREYKANLKGIRYETQQLENEKQDKLNQAEGQLASIRLDIRSKKEQLNNYDQNIVPTLQNSYRAALLAYEQNNGDLLSALIIVRDLLTAKMGRLDRLQELLQLQVAYERENEKY